jgi:hypothetical protein
MQWILNILIKFRFKNLNIEIRLKFNFMSTKKIQI